MGGVVDAISDAVGSVVDTVGDAVQWVGDTAGKVVQNALDHPVETALSIGVIAATGGAGAAALGLEAPLTALEASSALAGVSGASTLAHGGDLGDALTNAATTFAVSQGVNYAFDSFNATGAPGSGGSGTTQFYDDGSSMQIFDDGSRLVTNSQGAVTPVPASDTLNAGLQPSGAETTPVPEPGNVQTTELPPADATAPVEPKTTDISPSNVATSPEVTTTTQPQYNTMEQLLADKGLMPPASNLPESFGNAPAVNPTKPYNTMEDLMYDKGLINDAQYKDMTGVAPVVDLSQPAAPMPDISTVDALKNLGSTAIDYAKENPWTTAAIIGGGAAAAGAFGGDKPQTPATPEQKTYSYGPGAPVNRTGLQELWSAASKIYGPTQGPVGQPAVQAPQFQSNFQPVLAGPAPGATGFGLGALGQGFKYTPMGTNQTYDISSMTPEQIVQLQEASGRKKPGEGA